MTYQFSAVVRQVLSFVAGMAFMFCMVAVFRDGVSAIVIWNELEDSSLKIVAAVGAVASAVTVLVNGLKSWDKSSDTSQIARVHEIASDSSSPKSQEAKETLVTATASLPEVEKVVSPAMASLPSPKVVRE